MQFTGSLTPRVPKRFLLIIAAFAWIFAAAMLLTRGFILSGKIRHAHWPSIAMSIVAGGIFYLILFSRISSGHVKRIIGLQNERPSVFSFFSLRSYILMTLMISGGIILRKSGLLPSGTLSLLYITMGVPLFISSLRFFYNWIFYSVDSVTCAEEQ